MGDIKTQLKLTSDSANSSPGEVDISLSLVGDRVRFELANPDRTVSADLRRLKIVLTALEADRDAAREEENG